jgi:pyruvate dehydrogenase E1 component alpha subunit
MALDNDKLLELLRKMVLTRKMEEKHAELLAEKKPIAFAHFSTGMEAVGIGAMTAMRKDDVMIGSHRGFVEYIGKGMKPLDIWSEYLGKKHILDGKAGIQISDRENNIPGMTACIGGGFAIAAGMAYAIKKREEERVVVLCYGDGGYNQSDAHPAMIIASSWRLPLVFHVSYNDWAEYTPSDEFNPTGSVAARGAAYNIPADSVDGQRVDLVYEAAQKAIEHARSGKGPHIMEYRTHRQSLHWSGDLGAYIDAKERKARQEWGKRDPIKLCKEMLIEKKIITDKKYEEISHEIDNIVADSLEEAINLQYPDGNDMFSRVYSSVDR